ncbi:hypothetical protein [Flectobacillus sp. BAB-3569]|uniref:hypothetical protein n=1 Tax=Flectobacillus sp. BAB-3569 TaxID=1509483 RepID=UPI000BA494A8|nr:hypothetical protein [Flectobacillus sp. BAB-3569]PAC27783.1 hypothetical protein BWI92_21460 [Flectobacillus sp. BAB-3569]
MDINNVPVKVNTVVKKGQTWLYYVDFFDILENPFTFLGKNVKAYITSNGVLLDTLTVTNGITILNNTITIKKDFLDSQNSYENTAEGFFMLSLFLEDNGSDFCLLDFEIQVKEYVSSENLSQIGNYLSVYVGNQISVKLKK